MPSSFTYSSPQCAGASSLQADCGDSGANALAVGAAVGYLGQVNCSRFYSFLWWIVWFTFIIIELIPILIGTNSLSKFRGGLLGLLALNGILLFDTANTFQQFNGLGIGGSLISRARLTTAGAIVCSIATLLLIFAVGIHDEKKESVEDAGAPKGATYGGVYQPQETQPERMAYSNPTYTPQPTSSSQVVRQRT